MQRPATATQTRRPSPLMPATGTPPARVKRVPYRAAAAEETFRIRAVAAPPGTPRVRPPAAQRAANAALVRLFIVRLVNGIGPARRRDSLLEKREERRERPAPSERLSFHSHSSRRLVQYRARHQAALQKKRL